MNTESTDAPTDAPTVPRGISYAEAVRGPKKVVTLRTDRPVQSPKSEPASLSKPEGAPSIKVEPAQSTNPSAAHDRGTKSAEQPAPPPVKNPKIPAPAKAQNVRKKRQETKFSYAEAARGKKPPPPWPVAYEEDKSGQPLMKDTGSPVIAPPAGANSTATLEPDGSVENTQPGTASSPQKGKQNPWRLMPLPALPMVVENLATAKAKSKYSKKKSKKVPADLETPTNLKPPADRGNPVGNRRHKNDDSSMSPPKKAPMGLEPHTGKQWRRFPDPYSSPFTKPPVDTKAAHARRFSDGDRHPLSDKVIEERIKLVIREEEERVRKMKAMEFLVGILIRANDLRQLPLWECQMGWDVMIICRGKRWRVHHDLLSRESPYFQERLPPKDPNGTPVLFTLKSHQPEILGHALHFMYNKTYEGAKPNPNGPLDGEAIRMSVFMYLCGASVDYRLMMGSAVACIDEAAGIVMDAMLADRDIDTSRLFHPLLKAIGMALEQGARDYMIPLRISITRLICLLSRWMYGRQDFEAIYSRSPVWPLILVQIQDDVAWFHAQESALAGEGGCLEPPIEEQMVWDECLIGDPLYDYTDADGEVDYDGETTSSSEVYSNFGLDEYSLAPFSGSSGSGSGSISDMSSSLVAEPNDLRCEASDDDNRSDTTLRPGDDGNTPKQQERRDLA